jgi:hypothetical protein
VTVSTTSGTICSIFHGLVGYLKLIFSDEGERIGRNMTNNNETNKSRHRRRSLPISINPKHKFFDMKRQLVRIAKTLAR